MAKLASCHTTPRKKNQKNNGKHLTIALAGNANVGKSVLFNQLTGGSQVIGNWPGKTVERAEGHLGFEGYHITVIDLPGTYSFSTFSMEEVVTREYIAREKPDVIINVVDASVLERNLFLTLQLMEMEIPLVICLNQMDVSLTKGISIDARKLEESLGIPVMPTVAIKGKGVHELVRRAVEIAEQKKRSWTLPFRDGVERGIAGLARLIESEKLGLAYPPRWVAIKLLESDPEIKSLAAASENVTRASEALAREIEHNHQEPGFAVITGERYALAQGIVQDAQRQDAVKTTLSDRLDWLTTHPILGYLTSALVVSGLLLWTLVVGNYLSILLSELLSFFEPLNPQLSGPLLGILWNGAFGGLVAGVTLVIPYVIPFYLVLAVIEDSGILTRVAFMMDSLMHKMGLHGKAIIPLILGYGCNVPAIYTCRVMGNRRERLLASFAITFAPCAARTIIIIGLVAAFVSLWWALALYLIDLVIIFILGRLAFRIVPGKSTGLIMEMHSFRVPSLPVVARQTWGRTKCIINTVFPIYVLGSAAVQLFYNLGWLETANQALSPVTVGWLGLPAVTGVLLIFGLIRKEMILLALVAIFGAELNLFLTPVQLIVLALTSMLYLPCLATVTTLGKELGWKSAGVISLTNVAAAVLFGGIAYRLLSLVY